MPAPERTAAETEELEEQFLRGLEAAGLLLRRPTGEPPPLDLDRTPIEVKGKPLSETIIEERR